MPLNLRQVILNYSGGVQDWWEAANVSMDCTSLVWRVANRKGKLRNGGIGNASRKSFKRASITGHLWGRWRNIYQEQQNRGLVSQNLNRRKQMNRRSRLYARKMETVDENIYEIREKLPVEINSLKVLNWSQMDENCIWIYFCKLSNNCRYLGVSSSKIYVNGDTNTPLPPVWNQGQT